MSLIALCERCACPCREAHNRFCSRSCAMAYTRSRESAEERSQKGRYARACQENDRIVRMFARCRLQPTEELKLLAAYRFGLSASKQRRYKAQRVSA